MNSSKTTNAVASAGRRTADQFSEVKTSVASINGVVPSNFLQGQRATLNRKP